MQVFACKTKVVFSGKALDWLETQPCEKLLVVTDPYFQKNGWAQRIAQTVPAQQRHYFDKILPDPTVELAAEGTALMRQLQPDMILALGGGSAMDTAKAMVYFSGKKVKFIAIPTTSGSGSEVTDFAILTHGKTKHPLIDSSLRPDAAILSEELVWELPPALVADGGFDVLSHALESFVATGANPLTRALSADAFSVVYSNLQASFSGNRQVRGKIHLASCMAGMAFSQAGLGACHALSHSLGGVFHVPHGRLNAILLPEVVSRNAVTAAEGYGKLARLAGLGAGADAVGVRNLRNGLVRLRRELKLPATLEQAGIKPQVLRQHRKAIITAALADPCLRTNPVQIDGGILGEILEAVSGGR